MSTSISPIPQKVRLQVVTDRRGSHTGITVSPGLIVVHLNRKRKRQLHKALPYLHRFDRFAFDEVSKDLFPGESLLTAKGMEKLNFWHPIRPPFISVEEDRDIAAPEGFRVQSNEHRDIIVLATPEKVQHFSKKAHDLGLPSPAEYVAHILHKGIQALEAGALNLSPDEQH